MAALTPAAVLICLRFGFTAALLDSAIHCDQSFRNQSVGNRCNSDCFRTPVDGSDLHQYIFRTVFGIFDENIEIPVFIKYTCIEQFILHFLP